MEADRQISADKARAMPKINRGHDSLCSALLKQTASGAVEGEGDVTARDALEFFGVQTAHGTAGSRGDLAEPDDGGLRYLARSTAESGGAGWVDHIIEVIYLKNVTKNTSHNT
jgi:hypothetical protein